MFFIVVFHIECFVKLSAASPAECSQKGSKRYFSKNTGRNCSQALYCNYFREYWNVFDFICVAWPRNLELNRKFFPKENKCKECIQCIRNAFVGLAFALYLNWFCFLLLSLSVTQSQVLTSDIVAILEASIASDSTVSHRVARAAEMHTLNMYCGWEILIVQLECLTAP